MEIAMVIVVLLAVGMAAIALWLGIRQTRLAAELAAARSDVDSAERARLEGRAEIERVTRLEQTASAAAAALAAEKATLTEQLGGAFKAHEATRSHLLEKFLAEHDAHEKQWQAKLESQRDISAEQLGAVHRERDAIKTSLAQVELKFKDVFGSLAADALKSNNEQFITLAKQKFDSTRSSVDELVKLIAEAIKRTEKKLAVLASTNTNLQSETGKLVRALREPHVRGRYGEIQLKRVAELAGMSAYCDFEEQDQTRALDGTPLRPDMVVRMPSSRTVVVDAKTNIQAYIDAISAESPEEAERHLERFARHVADQATALAKKNYWTQYPGSPEFVVMFIPGDQFVDAALSRRPELLELAATSGVILASPSTLIGLLRAVAVGFKEEQLAQAATELRELGKELHDRVATAMAHMAGLGRALNQSVEKYNDFAGSYDRRLLPILRKFEESGVQSAKELPDLPDISVKARMVAPVPTLRGSAEPALLDAPAPPA